MKLGKEPFLGWLGARVLVIGSMLIAKPRCPAQGFTLESAGARFGFYAGGAGSAFHQGEAFVNWDLPWEWDLGSLWSLQTRLDASLGWLGQAGDNAAIGSVGPSLLLARERFPLSLEGGVSPTILTHSNFPAKDFGIPFQFTSHVGLNLDVTSHFRLSYRFQHMSNGGLDGRNPGLNLHLLGLSYLF